MTEGSGFRRGRRIGVDVGDARIGVASSDPDGMLATPVETVPAGPGSLARLVALAEEYQAVEVVVGLPRSLSGNEGPAAVKVRAYAGELAALLASAAPAGPPVPVRLVDERMTTVTATQGLRASGVKAKKGRAVIDQAAAVVILQSALEGEKTSGRPPGRLVGESGG
jgi:putative holliday junction resolvase